MRTAYKSYILNSGMRATWSGDWELHGNQKYISRN